MKIMTETYSCLDSEYKYYIPVKFFCILPQTFTQWDILDMYQQMIFHQNQLAAEYTDCISAEG